MAAASIMPLHEFEISNENPRLDIIRLLEKLRPWWNPTNVTIDEMTGGRVNRMYQCYLESDTDKSNTIVVRVNAELTTFYASHKDKAATYAILHAAGLGAPLYAICRNALVYGYICGESMDIWSLKTPQIGRLLACEIARFHSLDIQKLSPKITVGKFHAEKLLFYQEVYHRVLNGLPEFTGALFQDKHVSSMFPTRKKIQEELMNMEKKVLSLGSPIVFSHNDVNPQNIIYNKEQDRVFLIDYDLTSFNYQAFDLAYMFTMHLGITSSEISQGSYPDKKYQLQWLRSYLESLAEIKGHQASEVTDSEVEKLQRIVEKFTVLCCFYQIIIALNILSKQLKYLDASVDIPKFLDSRLKMYLEKKHILD